jgi:hypothetical protein
MRGILCFAFVLAIGLVASAFAQTAGPGSLPSGTEVVIVGEVSSHPRSWGILHEKKMQVEVGPQKADYTLHLSSAQMFDNTTGRKIVKSDLRDQWWVRAEGTVLPDNRRILVRKLEVIAKDEPKFRETAFWALGRERGYVETVAGSRQVYP